MAKSSRYSAEFYSNAVETAGETEGSGSSEQIETEVTVSEDSSALTKKCINLNSKNRDTLGIPIQIVPLSNMLSFERKDLIHRLKIELEHLRVFKKKIESPRTNCAALSSCSDILSCSNGHNGPRVQSLGKSSMLPSKKVNKKNADNQKVHGLNRGTSGRSESAALASIPIAASAIIMKQCEALLKRLMSHQYGWVFNTPVDAVKLNIPDYFTVIKHPMDLGTIKSKISVGVYSSPMEFVSDVRLTFKNAMTYNPVGNDVHLMADTLSKYFEVRWKGIEKKLSKTDSQQLLAKVDASVVLETAKQMPPSKKRKVNSLPLDTRVKPEPPKKVMMDKEKQSLGRELESLLGEMPIHIIDFLREHSSNGRECDEDEIEIDIDDLSDNTLFQLRKLLDDYLQEKQKNNTRVEPCEIEMLNEPGLSNSSMQPCKDNGPTDEDIDIVGNEPPVSSHKPVEIEKDTSQRSSTRLSPGSSSDTDSCSSFERESGDARPSPGNVSKVPKTLGSGAHIDEKISALDPFEGNRCVSGLDQLEHTSQQKLSSLESGCQEDGDSAPTQRQVSPEKLYRAAILKKRFADTILKAREKTLTQGEKGDPERLQKEREKLELEQRREKARLQAEAKAAEDACRRAEAEAAAEAKRKRVLEREAARQALLQMEKTVEINENSRFLEDLEILRSAPVEQLPSSVDETSPDHSQDGLGCFKFGGSNPLEQFGLYMKDDEEEEEGEPICVPNPSNDVEDGEIE